MNKIRNFAIIAHIDHGKSTLADRFLDLTKTVEKRKMQEQFLDQMDLEREKGITIKLQPVKMHYEYKHETYELNLIDTPGHVDFSYEVSRSLAAVEGAILLVDCSKGIQAQTLANLHLAQQQGLVIVPVINKIDLPHARPEETIEELANLLNIDKEEILGISAKNGIGIKEVLEAVIDRVPAPKVPPDDKLKALIFDSKFDAFKGVIADVRVFSGKIKAGDVLYLMEQKVKSESKEVGYFHPDLIPQKEILPGQIGYIATGLKDVSLCRIGETITLFNNQLNKAQAFPGYREPRPMVFASFYPQEADDYDLLKDALGKLHLSDAALLFEPESSQALGRGFKCGFLGMLHLEIIAERLRREFGLVLTITSPSVNYMICDNAGKEKLVSSANQVPDPHMFESIAEPWVGLEIVAPSSFLGDLMTLLGTLSGIYKNTEYLGKDKVILKYDAPLREIIVDFYDKLKNVSSGYASLSYDFLDYKKGDLVRMDVLVAGEKVEALSKIVARDKAYHEGKSMVAHLKKVIPRQMFQVSIQTAIGGKILAREDISAMKKDVTGYLYGGDYSRKKKLLEKQKKGKKKMKDIGRVRIPAEVYFSVLRK